MFKKLKKYLCKKIAKIELEILKEQERYWVETRNISDDEFRHHIEVAAYEHLTWKELINLYRYDLKVRKANRIMKRCNIENLQEMWGSLREALETKI